MEFHVHSLLFVDLDRLNASGIKDHFRWNAFPFRLRRFNVFKEIILLLVRTDGTIVKAKATIVMLSEIPNLILSALLGTVTQKSLTRHIIGRPAAKAVKRNTPVHFNLILRVEMDIQLLNLPGL